MELPDLGFHVINLNYPNERPVNTLCGGINTDLDCYAKVRLEILDGSDRTTLVDISRANSIENRLVKLLVYLSKAYPHDGWEQFLENTSMIKWSAIVASGHSQGGGQAGIIGRYHAVARVVMFAATDYNGRASKPANWIAMPESTPNATAAERFYSFSHQRDEAVNFTILSTQVYPAYGIDDFGPIVNVDSTLPPYNNTHALSSNFEITSIQVNYHGCIAVDRFVPITLDGMPLYKSVWEYLLSDIKPGDPSDTESPIVTNVLLSRKRVWRNHDPNLTITWSSSDNMGIQAHDIFFAEDGMHFSMVVATGLSGTARSFTWSIPNHIPRTRNGAIKIIARDEAEHRGESRSNTFIIR